MRYRPFVSGGLSTSAVSLALRSHAGDEAFRLICAALECGINTFSFKAGDEAAAEAVRRAVGSVGRNVLILMARLDLTGPSFEHQLREALRISGATAFNAAFIAPPADMVLSGETARALDAVRAARLTTRLGLVAEGEAARAQLSALDFDILALRYTIASGWAERNMVKYAAERDISILGYDHHVGPSAPPVAIVRGLSRLFRSGAKPADAEVYDFLTRTPGWTAEQITLAYALTEPGLASILVEADKPKDVEELAACVERELPAGVAAQIEMARFALAGRQRVA